jgi:tyrosyl-tRNA synthetase
MSSSSAPSPATPEETLAALRRGTAQITSEAELLEKLRLKRPLRVKLGVDPTAPDIHLGHTVVLQKLRQFQDLGHLGILIIGDFTTMIGDPSGRSATRPQLTHDVVMANAETYRRQAFKVLDPARTQIVFNGEWFELMHYEQVLRLNSRVTLQQMLQREDFRARLDSGSPVSLHELQYPLLQGWDSVMVQADVELGGTDQLFNILVGRDLQKEEGLPPQVAMLLPVLEGLDGHQKMSKSLGNYIGVTEAPGEMFGKVMSISDTLMERYYVMLLGEDFPAAIHPMEAKKSLAARIVARYHSEEAAAAARADFEQRFSQRDLEKSDLPTVKLPDLGADILTIIIASYQQAFGQVKSRGEARRLVDGGSIQWQGEKVSDVKAVLDYAAGGVLKLDKKRAVRVAAV